MEIKRRKEKGVDIEFMTQYAPMYVEAAKLTLRLGIAGILLSLVAGLVCALIQYYKVPVLKRIVAVYIELSRNTPLLVQLFLLYFGLPKMGIVWASETCAVVGLTFLGGSYMAEAFRSGLESVDKIQFESGLSIGLEHSQVMRLYRHPAGVVDFGSGTLRECDLFDQRDICVQRCGAGGSYVCGKGSDRSVL